VVINPLTGRYRPNAALPWPNRSCEDLPKP
jgi:hypothetical protein